MRIYELLSESININQYDDHGELIGYVVDTTAPEITNYLTSQCADKRTIMAIKDKYSKIAIIRNLYVNEDNRNEGIGSRLVSDAIDEAVANDAEAILLVADKREDNIINLVQWYENFGFEVHFSKRT